MTYDTMLPDPDRHAEFYAGVPTKRALAWVADMVLIAVVTAIIVPFTAFTALFFLPFLYLVVGFVYRTLTLAGGSATWGMRLMAIELRDYRGQRFDLATAILHTLGYSISIGMVAPQVLSAGLMLVTPRAQGLTDLLMGSVAINRAARY
ncbi:RDD family protein [Rhodobacter ferrooxidans]|uniref:RDD domain containing protein n=1 Tax=Rhodobacter ferrooxidans TaxID=371731 RepID=C8RXY0_9RHOB|nr:RDD family protein [Rhodobacter sp. SW2]EEW26378.1 RDD domain containing protein [Rhodobacter sp. SW2]